MRDYEIQGGEAGDGHQVMKAEITKVLRVKEATLPPGKYEGTWCGYVITLKMDNGEWQLSTNDGVRGSVPCTVEVYLTGRMALVLSETNK